MAVKSTKTRSKSVKKTAVKKEPAPQKRHIYKPFVVFAVGFFLLIISAYIFKGIFIAANVNGESISRIVVVKELEKQSGKAVLEGLITQKLVIQEAKKRGIDVTSSEVDSEIKKIEESLLTQGTTLDQALELQSMTRNQLITEIRIQQLIQKMVTEGVEVSNEDIDKFIEENKDQFPESTTEAQMKEQARDVLIQQILQEKQQTFLEDLRTKAVIKSYISY